MRCIMGRFRSCAGGLCDSVTATLSGKTATGFLFDDATLPALKRAIDRALELYNQPFT